MIEPTEADIGRSVLYTGNRFVGGKMERGVITGLNHWTVFVRYGSDAHAKATSRENLEWEDMLKPGQFRAETALHSLLSGEEDAMHKLLQSAVFMEGFARGADGRFAAIEARLKALEDRNEAVPGGAGFGRVVSPTPRQADEQQLPQDRDAAGGAVEASGEVPLSASGRTAPQRDDG
jgi:hypothetical protein